MEEWAAKREAYKKKCLEIGEKLRSEIVAKLGDDYKCAILAAGEYDDEGYYMIFVKKNEDFNKFFALVAEYKDQYGTYRWGRPTDYAYEVGVVKQCFDGDPNLKEMGFDETLEQQYI